MGGTILGGPMIGIIAYWGLYWGPLILGNYHNSWFYIGFGVQGHKGMVVTPIMENHRWSRK